MVTLVWGGGEGVLGEAPPPLVFNYSKEALGHTEWNRQQHTHIVGLHMEQSCSRHLDIPPAIPSPPPFPRREGLQEGGFEPLLLKKRFHCLRGHEAFTESLEFIQNVPLEVSPPSLPPGGGGRGAL